MSSPAIDPNLGLIDVEFLKTPTCETANKEKKADKEKKPKKEEKEKKEDEKVKKPPNWRIEEDQSLCTSWINTSKDAATGTDQTKTAFWDRIHQLYEKIMEEIVEKNKNNKKFKPFPTRLKGALKNRWYHIQHQVNKYCGYFLQVQRRMRSGSINDDITVEAKILFKTDTGKAFTLDHCWGILHHSPKWIKNMGEVGGRAKSKVPNDAIDKVTPASSDVPSSCAATEDSSVHSGGRPKGSKAAKKRKNDDVSISDLIKGQHDLLEISRNKQRIFQSFTDDIVMSKDLSNMDDETREYFLAKRKLAMKRLKFD